MNHKPDGWGEANVKRLDVADLKTFCEDDVDDISTLKEAIKAVNIHFALFAYAGYIRRVGDFDIHEFLTIIILEHCF